MSKKFHDRLLRSSGLQTRPFHSSFGASLLKKFGWEEGQGLGKESNGRVECLQIRRREENVGLGHEDASETKAQDQWRNWWDGLYNSMAEKLRATAAKRRASQSTLSSESDEEGEGSAVKPLYGKKSVLSAGRRAQKNSSLRHDTHSTLVVKRTCATYVAGDTGLQVEHEVDTASEKSTDTCADRQKKPEAFTAFVDGENSTAACTTPSSHVSSPSCSDPPALATSQLSAIHSADVSDRKSVPLQRKKRKKKHESFEVVLNAATPVEGAVDGTYAGASPHESQTEKKKRKRKKKNVWTAADPEFGDENAAQVHCGGVSRIECVVVSECVESCSSVEPLQSTSNSRKQNDVLLPHGDSAGGGEEPPTGGVSSSEEPRKIRKKRKRERETSGTKEESRTWKEGVEADEGEGDADVKKKKKKSKLERAVRETDEKGKKNKQEKTISDL